MLKSSEQIIQLLSNEYNFNYSEAVNKLTQKINLLEINIENIEIKNNPSNTLINIINQQNNKENKSNIWKNSLYNTLPKLQSNNIGNVGEMYIEYICKNQNIISNINGTKTKKKGGRNGDGFIKNKSIEIKTAHKGYGRNFQHELGEHPWNAEYMIFVDISPEYFYITIFPNFSKQQYKACIKCGPYFPTRSFCWRKKSGAFKFDTTEKLNEESIKKGNTIKIINNTKFEEIGIFINKIIKN